MTLTYGAWQGWEQPIGDADVGRRVLAQLRSGFQFGPPQEPILGTIERRKPAPALVRLDDGRVLRLHHDCDGYCFVFGEAAAQREAA